MIIQVLKIIIIEIFKNLKKIIDIENKYLEVGSGPGFNLLLADKLLSVNPEGIEYNNKLSEISNLLHRYPIHNIDAMNFKKYNKYDIIYCWLPFFNEELQLKLEKKIVDESKVGTFLLLIDSENISKFDSIEFI